MSNNRDFKREHFEDRQTGKFQQNVYDKFRKASKQAGEAQKKLDEKLAELSNGFDRAYAKNSGSTSLTLNKTSERPVYVSISANRRANSTYFNFYVYRNGSLVISAEVRSQDPTYFVFPYLDTALDNAPVTYSFSTSDGLTDFISYSILAFEV